MISDAQLVECENYLTANSNQVFTIHGTNLAIVNTNYISKLSEAFNKEQKRSNQISNESMEWATKYIRILRERDRLEAELENLKGE